MTINPVAFIPYPLLIAGGLWLGMAIHGPALGVVLALATCAVWAYALHLTGKADRAQLQQTHQHSGPSQIGSPDC
jgi:hypothetical protein